MQNEDPFEDLPGDSEANEQRNGSGRENTYASRIVQCNMEIPSEFQQRIRQLAAELNLPLYPVRRPIIDLGIPVFEYAL
jgi:hypothetical protein